MNTFRNDLLIILKKLKYKRDALFLVKKLEDDKHYPYHRIGFTEEEIRSFGISIDSVYLLHKAVNDLLEIPVGEILEWRFVVDVDESKMEPEYMIEPANYLIFTISPKLEEVIEVLESNKITPVTFDEKRSLLIIRNIPFELSRKSDLSNAHYIFYYIFSNNPEEEHFYSDMNDENILGDKKEPETFYKALNTVRERLAKERGVEDFFEKISTGKTGSVKINKKYL